MKRIQDDKAYLAHFPKGFSNKIKTFAINNILIESRYVFTWRTGKQQFGYCTHCKKEFKTNGLKHNQENVICPECGSRCTVKASGVGRSKLVDEGYFEYYEKSVLDPNVIVVRGIYVVRDYRGDFRQVRTEYADIAFYFFKMGESVMFKRDYYYYSWRDCRLEVCDKINRTASVYTLFFLGHLGSIASDYSRKNIANVVKNTSFKYSTWESYKVYNMVEFFDLYAKHPCVEYLTKLGFDNLVREKLRGNSTLRTINWRGKNLLNVLRLTKQEFNEIKALKIDVTYYFLYVMQHAKKNNWGLSVSEAAEIAMNFGFYSLEEIEKYVKYGTIKQIYAYFKKQMKLDPERFRSLYNVYTTWSDYIEQCVKLKKNMTREIIIFPKNIHQAHLENTIKIKVRADKNVNKKIIERYQELNKAYSFESQGLLIRPAMDMKEMIMEGEILSHCVADYAERHAEGRTTILFIRELSAPDKPFFTLELVNGIIRQVHGFDNCDPTEKIQKFVDMFMHSKVKKSNQKVKLSA